MSHLGTEGLTLVNERDAARDVDALERVVARVSCAWSIVRTADDRAAAVGISPLVERVVVNPTSRREPLLDLRHEHRVIARRRVGDEERCCPRSGLGDEPQSEDERGGLSRSPTTSSGDDLILAA